MPGQPQCWDLPVAAAEWSASFQHHDALSTMPQREAHVERVIRFAAFAPSQPPAAAAGVALEFTEGLLDFLLGMSGAADKAVRYRACQLMGAIFTALPDVELTDVRIETSQDLCSSCFGCRSMACKLMGAIFTPDVELAKVSISSIGRREELEKARFVRY